MECRKTHKTQTVRRKAHFSLVCIGMLLCLAMLPTSLPAHPTLNTLISQGDSCRNLCFFNKALSFYQQAYEDPSVARNADLQMQLLERIMRSNFMLNRWKEMSESSYQLYHLAKRHHNSVYLAKALFMRGIRFYMEGERASGYAICLDAMERIKAVDCDNKNHELSVSCALLTNMYISDKRYKDAASMLDNQERYMRLDCDHMPDSHCMYRVYANRIYLLALMGRTAEADSLYTLYGDISVVDPFIGSALMNYLRLCHRDEEALKLIEFGLQHIVEDGDTMGRNMRRVINDQGDIYFRMGQYEKAAECYAGMGRIADSISIKTLRNVSAEVYKVIDSEHAIARHRQILITTIGGILLLLTIIILLGRHSLMERRKNHSMSNTIQQLLRYRDQIIQNGDSVEMGENNENHVANTQYSLFKEIDKRIMKEKLFAQPDFGRDDLMRLFGVDKNTLPALIQRYAGTNVPGYVNNKRMEYAVSLIKQHPEYTLSAISEACGIKSPATFIRNFKNAYGMTPSDFRKELDVDALSSYS